jgi:GNAT superfamily N-acetyltransferase
MKKKPSTACQSIRIREVAAAEMLSIFPLVQMNNPNITKAIFTKRLKDMLPFGYHAVAAFDGEKMVGISGFWLRSRFWCGRQLDIDNFFVHPDYRSAGLGKKLVAWLEKRAIAEKCELIVLDTYADYFLAQRFYHREGFVSTGYHMTKVPGTNVPFGRCNK